MDILTLIKSSHEKLLSQCKNISCEEENKKFLKNLKSYFLIEKDFLFPEIEDFLDKKNIKKNVLKNENLMNDYSSLNEYFMWQQKEIMPIIRTNISSSEREDMGYAFLELEEELLERDFV